MGSEPLPQQLEGLGSTVRSPSRVQGGAPAAQRFSYILGTLGGFSCYIIE